MFIRYKCIKGKNGKTHTYAYKVKAIWITRLKQARQKVVKYIGKIKGMNVYSTKEIFERDGYKCRICKKDEDLTIDHIVPMSKGGDNTKDNLQVLCMKCNQFKGINLI